MVKTEYPIVPMHSGQRRPMSSELGAHINGPEANPRTKRLVPRIQTSLLTENSSLAPAMPAANSALSKDATNVA